jgi:hypothetical protein
MTDYDLLMADYGKNAAVATTPAADLDGNGLVGYSDYLFILQNWGDGC